MKEIVHVKIVKLPRIEIPGGGNHEASAGVGVCSGMSGILRQSARQRRELLPPGVGGSAEREADFGHQKRRPRPLYAQSGWLFFRGFLLLLLLLLLFLLMLLLLWLILLSLLS